MFQFFKSKKEVIYVQEPNPEKSRQLFYVDISKDAVISKAKEQHIVVSDTELDWIKDDLFDRVMKDVQASIQAHLFDCYTDVAQEIINAFGGPDFEAKLKEYRKILLGIEITLPENKSRAEKVIITRQDKQYNMIFSGQDVFLPVNKVSLEQAISSFEAITGIVAVKPDEDTVIEDISDVMEAKPKPAKKQQAA